MAVWTPYLIAYLCGMATSVLIVRRLLKDNQDGSSCLLDIVLGFIASLIMLAMWLGSKV